MDNVYIIPSATIYQGSFVYLVEDGLLRRQEVTIQWQNSEDALVSAGLEPGNQLVVTTLGQVTSGTRVLIVGDDKKTVSGGELTSVAGSENLNAMESEQTERSSTL